MLPAYVCNLRLRKSNVLDGPSAVGREKKKHHITFYSDHTQLWSLNLKVQNYQEAKAFVDL